MDADTDRTKEIVRAEQMVTLAKLRRIYAVCDEMQKTAERNGIKNAVIEIYLDRDDFFTCKIGTDYESHNRINRFIESKKKRR